MEYEKKVQIPLSAHFSTLDFDCQCPRPECRTTLIDGDLVDSLETLWDLAGSFKITSGYRCPAHNKEIGGVKSSQHCLGKAADCKSTSGKESSGLQSRAVLVPRFRDGGIGLYRTFLHCDVRNGRARWSAVSIIVPC